MVSEARREFLRQMSKLYDEGRLSPRHCRGCGLLLDDVTLLYCDDCTPPPIKCGACNTVVTGKLSDHFCRPAPGMSSECERIRGANEAEYQRKLREAVE